MKFFVIFIFLGFCKLLTHRTQVGIKSMVTLWLVFDGFGDESGVVLVGSGRFL